jgi:hypothetical protein
LEHFYRAQQNLSSLNKKGRRPAEKNLPVFFHMPILDLDFYDMSTQTEKEKPKKLKRNFFINFRAQKNKNIQVLSRNRKSIGSNRRNVSTVLTPSEM